MVLFKRKPVQYLPRPTNIPDNAEVFVMRGTNEVFTDYERYVQRLDYLSQKKFVDAVNGKSGLTYFAALQSETKSSIVIENVFPDVLRDPILRKVQFSTIARMDDLVNEVFNDFKHDFFPGEEVICSFDDAEQTTGVIREKAQFPMIRGPAGEVQREAFSRYFVRLHAKREHEEEGLFDHKHLRRDRKVFTKMNLRAFLKHSLQREAWSGAPWLAKESLAIQYRLPMEIPTHLLQEAKLLANKQSLQANQIPRRRPKNMSPEEFKAMKKEEKARMQHLSQQQPGAPHPQQSHPANQPAVRAEQKLPPAPIIKYPIEDLDISPKRNGVKRPKLKHFNSDKAYADIEKESMGMLLEVWNTLNVQCEVYVLDSFTFDDFVDAMDYHSTDLPCVLLEEIHCAVLKLIVDSDAQVTLTKGALPEMITESSDESDEDNDESEVSTPVADVPARSTRSRLSQVVPVPNGTVDKMHRAQEMLAERSWITRLGARDFQDGGWQVILVGLLYNLSLAPHYKARCDKVLAELAPVDEEPTRETARLQYANMDINMRISALQMITILSIATPAIKEFLEACADDMTDVRKKKIEYQKLKKTAMDDLAAKDRDRKILLPENMPAESPKQESVEPVSANGDLTEDSIDVSGAISSDPDDDAPANGRSLRRGQDRKRKREEEAARVAEEKARKAEAAKKENKLTREFKKILADMEELKKQIIDCESKITECDADLREANVQRTRVLGKDRFCNRYYWFERNGQPFGGLPRSSTSGYGYANARVWVQGPDAMELDGFVGQKEQQLEYQRRFGLTIPERRKLEEGDTILNDALDWGYYDDPLVLDNLIHWLDDRGDREKPLRKELCAWRDTIVQYMDARKNFVDEEAAKRLVIEDEPQPRIATRRQEREEQVAARERCLRWTNTMAVDEIGHLHSQSPTKAKTRTKGGAPARQGRGVAIPVNRTRPR